MKTLIHKQALACLKIHPDMSPIYLLATHSITEPIPLESNLNSKEVI
jgi:hypothetical protein